MTAKLGRSLLAGETTIDEIRKLTKSFKTAKHYIRDDMAGYAYDSVVVDGDLVIDGDFATFDHSLCRLVVTGSLKVSGTYRDCDDPETAVFVLGDLEAKNAITNGALCVGGSVIVEEALVGFYNDHCAEIKKHVQCGLFIPENHHFGIEGVLGADHVIGYGAQYRVPTKLMKRVMPVEGAKLKDILVPEVIGVSGSEEDGDLEVEVDQAEIRKRVAKGLPIRWASAGASVATIAPGASPKNVKIVKTATAAKAAKQPVKKARKGNAKKAAAKKPPSKAAARAKS